MAETNSLLYQNSKTGLVQAGQKYFQPRAVGTGTSAAGGIGAGMAGLMATAAGMPEAGLVGMLYGAGKTAKLGAQYLGNLSDRGTATSFAKLASAGDGPARNQLIGILQAAQSGRQGNKLGNLTPSLMRLAAP